MNRSVTSLTGAMQLPAPVQSATRELENKLMAAIREAKDQGLPQGMIVALMVARTQIETGVMIDDQ